MDAAENPFEADARYLTATGEKLSYAQEILEELSRVVGDRADPEDIEALAQCMAIAEWEGPLPGVCRVKATRHALRGFLYHLIERVVMVDGEDAKERLGEFADALIARFNAVMDRTNDQRGAFHDLLQATLANQARAEALLDELGSALHLEEQPTEQDILRVAQCLAMADWTGEEQYPAVFSTEAGRHDLKTVLAFFHDCEEEFKCEAISGHEELRAIMKAVVEKGSRILARCKQRAEGEGENKP